MTDVPGNAVEWHDRGVRLQQSGDFDEARAAFLRAIELDPALTSAYNNLGNTLYLAGDMPAAVDYYRRALALDPGVAATHGNAAAALHVLGRNHEALEHAVRSVELDPNSLPPRITKAMIDAALVGFGPALVQIDALCAAAPDNPILVNARIHCLLMVERFEDALAAIEAAAMRRPGDPLLDEFRGLALRGIGRIDDSVAAFQRAAAAGHRPAEMLVFQGYALIEQGRMREAEALFEAALALVPELATAWAGFAEVHAFVAGDPALERMEQHLAATVRPPARVHLHFALGRGYQKAGDPANAFRHLEAGNALKRSSFAYDVAVDERVAQDAITAFPVAVMRSRAGIGDPSRAPVFIVGMPRSGTTLIEQILASHPQFFGAGELTLFDQAIAECTPGDVRAIGARYLALIDRIAPPHARTVDKLPGNFRHVGLIHLALPNARIIHAMRDPVDTCFSAFCTNFSGRIDFAYDLVECGRYYNAYAKLMEHWRTVLEPGVMLEVRYEDVVADLAAQARRMLAFLDAPWDDRVLRFHERAGSIRTASFTQARKPIYATSVRSSDPYRAWLGPLLHTLQTVTPEG